MASSTPNSQHDENTNTEQPAAKEAAKGAANDNRSHPVLAWAGQVVATFYQSVKADRTLPAIAREAVKDVRSTIMDVAFGQHERGGEPGAPMNPLPSEIANDTTPYGMPPPATEQSLPTPEAIAGEHAAPDGQPLPSPADILRGVQGVQPNDQGQHDGGQVFEQRIWQDRIERERGQSNQGGGEDGYDRQKERIKPEEERQKEKEQERDGGGRGGRC